jgi:hypothetical protein
MTWTYSGDPSASMQDQVRFLLGDTTLADAKISDEEILYLIEEWEDDPYEAAAAAAEHLSNTAASWLSYTADGNSLSLSEAQEKYARMAISLRATKARKHRAAPYVGGIEVGDVWMHENDLSVVKTDFGTEMHDNRREGAHGGSTKEDLLGGPW